MELYTIAETARNLKIPESTDRYYRDRHIEYLPYMGTGRKRRYKKQTLEALRSIIETANNSLSAEEINN